MKLPAPRIGKALLVPALIFSLSGLAVAAKSGLFSGDVDKEGLEYAIVVWSIGGGLLLGSTVILILNSLRNRK